MSASEMQSLLKTSLFLQITTQQQQQLSGEFGTVR